ncbi:molybdate ABC transporter substrate-binding protein [Bacillus thermotolerans]|uniref:Molybdenum ABC transporter, periplasmic molybdenum-binding protein ModA n=1 Tax=Bacillus thermotolerans TaxID=1221996 RepID=A0A0F5HU26_BACTR|nr:molybdate ABC transporter substrate-binding protein [Bacillus thermotolerans]KKB36894.1 Molybdenum ABC transporter, periplasmic molybdenum-binding protein ModA [Bacillus thermotolerans]KKB39612.1 Molybdenum ABC transporter, periplasmic molybdenum-binding protein ModA [Bacillus thermotolerans]
MRKRGWLAAVCTAIVFLSACTFANERDAEEGESQALTIAAASDLQFAFKEMEKHFEEQTGRNVEITFSSTGTLAQQIDNGAPYDVFAAANVSFIEELEQKGKLVPDTQVMYSEGELSVVSSKGSSVSLTSIEDLANSEVKKIAIANPEHAPYGMAAKQALERAGLWEKVKDKLIYGKSVADTLALVATGNAEAGIVSRSIVTEEVQGVPVDPQLHEPIRQAMAIVEGTKQEELARSFVEYVTGEEGQRLLQSYGFHVPGSSQ